MCFYVLKTSLCGHDEPELLAGPSCLAFAAQLNRIHEAAAWASPADPEAEARLPFDWPESCEPSPGNMVEWQTWCGAACRNGLDPFGRLESLGPPWPAATAPETAVDVAQGVSTENPSQLGIGWRD